jgi:hypothetical protein
VEEGVGKEKE